MPVIIQHEIPAVGGDHCSVAPLGGGSVQPTTGLGHRVAIPVIHLPDDVLHFDPAKQHIAVFVGGHHRAGAGLAGVGCGVDAQIFFDLGEGGFPARAETHVDAIRSAGHGVERAGAAALFPLLNQSLAPCLAGVLGDHEVGVLVPTARGGAHGVPVEDVQVALGIHGGLNRAATAVALDVDVQLLGCGPVFAFVPRHRHVHVAAHLRAGLGLAGPKGVDG